MGGEVSSPRYARARLASVVSRRAGVAPRVRRSTTAATSFLGRGSAVSRLAGVPTRSRGFVPQPRRLHDPV